MEKPHLTFEEQIERLKHHYGLKIDNESYAYEVLRSLSYYDLVNGYQQLYMRDGRYLPGLTIDQIALTHMYNKHFQSLIMKYCIWHNKNIEFGSQKV